MLGGFDSLQQLCRNYGINFYEESYLLVVVEEITKNVNLSLLTLTLILM